MQRKSAFINWSILLLGGWLLSSCAAPQQPGSRIDPNAYPILKAAVARDDMVWRRVEGPDFEVFYGNPGDSKACGFGFYVGGFPNFHPPANAVMARNAAITPLRLAKRWLR